MSRREWRCRNPACSVKGGAVLGRLTADGGLVLDPVVRAFRVFMDTRRAIIICPACHSGREFLGSGIFRTPAAFVGHCDHLVASGCGSARRERIQRLLGQPNLRCPSRFRRRSTRRPAVSAVKFAVK